VIRPKDPDQQFEALTNLVTSEKLKTPPDVEALPLFQQWNTELEALERWYSLKYGSTIVLTITFFLAGAFSLFVKPLTKLSVGSLALNAQLVIVAGPMLLVGTILVVILITNWKEKSFRELLQSLTDRM
jgi:hypothetical protein